MRPGSRPDARPTLALAVLAALLVAGPVTVAGATAAGPSPAVAEGGREPSALGGAAPALQDGDPERNRTTIDVQLEPDGDARWRVSTSFRLNDSADRAAFRDLGARFERGDADVGYDAETFRRARRAANRTVNRTMRIQGVDRNATVVNRTDGTATGRLTLRFTWTRFGTVENDTYRVGDAFTTADGTWLPGLADQQTLLLRPPPGFGYDTVPVPPQGGLLRWDGPTEFEPESLSATFERSGPTPTPSPTASPTVSPTPASPSPSPTPSPPGGTTDPPEQDRTLLLVGGIGGIVVLALAIVVLTRRRSDGLPGIGDRSTGTDGGSPAAAGTGDDTAEDDPETTADDDSEAAEGAAATEPGPELLSDEERVERLLEESGGRMKQANIVSETGWSNAKVSQLLSAMAEEDRVDKLRIGRENLISLPDEDVTDIEDNG